MNFFALMQNLASFILRLSLSKFKSMNKTLINQAPTVLFVSGLLALVKKNNFQTKLTAILLFLAREFDLCKVCDRHLIFGITSCTMRN